MARTIVALALSAARIRAQEAAAPPPAQPLTVTSNVDPSVILPNDAAIQVTLSRPLASGEGDLVILVGGTDVTALSRRDGMQLVYQPGIERLPAGASDVVVYLRSGGGWRELRRFPIKVLNAAGFARAGIDRNVTLGNKGQLAEGRSDGIPAPDRRTFQDFVLNGGIQVSVEHPGFTLESRSNYVGVSREQEALRFGVKGPDAPKLDLTDYLVSVRSRRGVMSIGHVSFGESRHLVNGFSARGGTVAWTHGATTVMTGALNGTPIVGWSNLIGFDRSDHRILGASITHELVASRPGLLRVDLTALNGSILPLTGFAQGAVVDAERSSGQSVQLSAATPDQRLHLTGGYTRSRFTNPRRDPQLFGDSLLVAVAPETRGARYLELLTVVLQNRRLPLVGPSNVSIGWRHERVDPLFRSVAARTSADRRQDAVDATVSLGSVVLQLSQGWTNDNLDRVPTILTTNGRTLNTSLSIPLSSMMGARRHGVLLPSLVLTAFRARQFAVAEPTGDAFRPQDIPDQISLNGDVAANWQLGTWRLSAHATRTRQDNRQPLREQADFASGRQALSIGKSLGSADLGLDVGHEQQTSLERDETTRVQRLTFTGSLRPRATTSLGVAMSLLRSRSPAGASSLTGDQRLELTQGLNLWPGAAGAQRGQFFVRFGRSTSRLPDFSAVGTGAAGMIERRQWTLASGLNLRLF